MAEEKISDIPSRIESLWKEAYGSPNEKFDDVAIPKLKEITKLRRQYIYDIRQKTYKTLKYYDEPYSQYNI